MALIIEDGTMPEGANAFASVDEADAYLSARNIASWPVPASDLEQDNNLSAKEAALVRASDYLNTLAWRGVKADWNWPMCWPRKDVPVPGSDKVIPADVVPVQVKRACMELAALFYAGEDLLAAVERGGRVASETVGPISTSYFDDASNETFYPAVAGLIGDFLTVIPGEAGGDHYTMLKVVPC